MNTTPVTLEPGAVAVIGGTGRTGHRVADRLRARGVEARIGSRTTSPAFAWEHPETWEPMLHGCAAAYVAYSPDISDPGAEESLGAFAELAHRCRVRRLVLLSGRGEAGARRAEDAVRAAGVPTMIIRSSVFAQNFSEHFFRDAVVDGVIVVPAGDVGEPFLDLEDLADVAVRLRRQVVYRPVTVDEFITGAVSAGVPRDEADVLGAVFSQIFDGRDASVTTTVEDLLGRPAGRFGDYVRRAAASGVWNVGAPVDGVPS